MVMRVLGTKWVKPATHNTYENSTNANGLAKVIPRSGNRRKITKQKGRARMPRISTAANHARTSTMVHPGKKRLARGEGGWGNPDNRSAEAGRVSSLVASGAGLGYGGQQGIDELPGIEGRKIAEVFSRADEKDWHL